MKKSLPAALILVTAVNVNAGQTNHIPSSFDAPFSFSVTQQAEFTLTENSPTVDLKLVLGQVDLNHLRSPETQVTVATGTFSTITGLSTMKYYVCYDAAKMTLKGKPGSATSDFEETLSYYIKNSPTEHKVGSEPVTCTDNPADDTDYKEITIKRKGEVLSAGEYVLSATVDIYHN